MSFGIMLLVVIYSHPFCIFFGTCVTSNGLWPFRDKLVYNRTIMAEDHVVRETVVWPFGLYWGKLGLKVTKHVKMAVKTDKNTERNLTTC